MIDVRSKSTATLLLLLGVLGTGTELHAHHRLASQEAKSDSPSANDKDEAARKDLYGDPLPPGAEARMGTIRLRGAYDALAFSPDGKTVLSTDRLTIQAWDVASGKPVRRTPLSIAEKGRAPLLTLCVLTQDGKTLVTPDVSGPVYVWDAVSGKERCHVSIPRGLPRSVAISDDGRTLAVIFATPQREYLIHLWDARTGAELCRLRGHENYAIALGFSPGGKTLASTNRDGSIELWKTDTGTPLHKLRLKDGPLKPLTVMSNQLVFSPDGKLLAAGDGVQTLKVWDAQNGKERATLEALSKGTIEALDFSPDGKTLAVRGTESIALWDLATRKLLRQWPDRSTTLNPLRFSPNGKLLAWTEAGKIRLWDVRAGKPLHSSPGDRSYPLWVGLLPDGKTLVTRDRLESRFYSWDIGTGRLRATLPLEGGNFLSNALSANGKYLASSFRDGTLRVWQWPDGKEVRRVDFASDGGESKPFIYSCQLSPDGTRLAALAQLSRPGNLLGATLIVWDVATGKQHLNRRLPASQTSYCAELAPDGRTVAIPREDGLALEDVFTGQERLALSGHLGAPLSFSPDGQILAAGLYQPRARGKRPALSRLRHEIEEVGFWELATGQPIRRVKTGPVERIAFSSNGRLLATAGKDSLILWDIASGKPVLRRPLEKVSMGIRVSAVLSLAFTPDGRYVTTGMVDGTVLVWDVADATRPPKSPHALEHKELDRAWTDLTGDASVAQTAIAALTASPAQTIALFNERLHPATDAPAEQLRRLLADLDSPDFTIRDAADRELKRLGDLAGPALRRALEAKPTLEVRRRIESVLSAICIVRQPEALRRLRAVRVLEQIDTPEARQMLRKLAEGSHAARETLAARAAFHR